MSGRVVVERRLSYEGVTRTRDLLACARRSTR
jgi:hypothetical protein